MNRNTVNQAFWIQKTHLFRKDEYICSVCRFVADKPYKHCPECDSEMRKTKYDPNWVDEAEFMDIFLS